MRSQGFCPTNTGAPNTLVDGVFGFFPVPVVAVLDQVINLGLTRKLHVTDGRNDFQVLSQDVEGQVKTNLVVPCPGTAMCHCSSTNFLGIFGRFNGLEHPFGTYRQGIGVVAQHVSKNHVTNTLVVIIVQCIGHAETFGTQLQGAFFHRF